MAYWIVITSVPNFRYDREVLKFKTQGLPHRYRKSVQYMQKGDKVIYYILRLQKFGAIVNITGEYYEDNTKIWTDVEEMWPSRRPSEPILVLQDNELIDAKNLVPNLTFIRNKVYWGTYFQGSIRQIPEKDYHLIESEMRKAISHRQKSPNQSLKDLIPRDKKTEIEYEQDILNLSLESTCLHDRIAEMLEHIGLWLNYNIQTKQNNDSDLKFEYDLVWLKGRYPEIAIKIQIYDSLVNIKDIFYHANKSKYKKIILVIHENNLSQFNTLIRNEHDQKLMIESWSIGAIYEMYISGKMFTQYSNKLVDPIDIHRNKLQYID